MSSIYDRLNRTYQQQLQSLKRPSDILRTCQNQPSRSFEFKRWTAGKSSNNLAERSDSNIKIKFKTKYFPSLSSLQNSYISPFKPKKILKKSKAVIRPVKLLDRVKLMPFESLLEYQMNSLSAYIQNVICSMIEIQRWIKTSQISNKKLSDSLLNYLFYVTSEDQVFTRGFVSTKLPYKIYVLLQSQICKFLSQSCPQQRQAVHQLKTLMTNKKKAIIASSLYQDLGGYKVIKIIHNQFKTWFSSQGQMENLSRKINFRQTGESSSFDILIDFLKGRQELVASALTLFSGILNMQQFGLMKFKFFKSLTQRQVYNFVICKILRDVQTFKEMVVQPENVAHISQQIYSSHKNIKKRLAKRLIQNDKTSREFLKSNYDRFFNCIFQELDLRKARDQLMHSFQNGIIFIQSFLKTFELSIKDQFPQNKLINYEAFIVTFKLRLLAKLKENPLKRIQNSENSLIKIMEKSQDLYRNNNTLTQYVKVNPWERINFFLDEEHSGYFIFYYLINALFSSQYFVSSEEAFILMKLYKIGNCTPKLWCELLASSSTLFPYFSQELRQCGQSMELLFGNMDMLFSSDNS